MPGLAHLSRNSPATAVVDDGDRSDDWPAIMSRCSLLRNDQANIWVSLDRDLHTERLPRLAGTCRAGRATSIEPRPLCGSMPRRRSASPFACPKEANASSPIFNISQYLCDATFEGKLLAGARSINARSPYRAGIGDRARRDGQLIDRRRQLEHGHGKGVVQCLIASEQRRGLIQITLCLQSRSRAASAESALVCSARDPRRIHRRLICDDDLLLGCPIVEREQAFAPF